MIYNHAIFSLCTMTGYLALVLSVSLYQADEPEDESRSDDSFLKDKPVVCLECEERFASIGDAAAKLHLNARKLGNAIRENEPYHGLHFFLIAESWQDETK